jgi:hypothetical protein
MKAGMAIAVLAASGFFVGATVLRAGAEREGEHGCTGGKALRSVTINTGAYAVPGKQIDRRSESITANEDMHIVGIEHFAGVERGVWSDNGHMLSLGEENAWTKWEKAGTGMEPTGTQGYFGYCGRDYYTEVGGIGDVMQYEMLPAGTHILVRKGQRLYMHCYACNFGADQPKMFHHAVRLLYW